MEITIEKIAMIRENFNPQNTDLNLNIDWSVEYKNTDQRDVKYDIHLKSLDAFDLNFKIGGFVKLQYFEEFIQQECSQIIFHHACTILMNMISLTRQSNYELCSGELNSKVDLYTTF